MRVAVIEETGEICLEDIPRDDEDGLSALQRLVRGYIESPSIIRDGLRHLTMWCNEEGKFNGCLPNPTATDLVGYSGYDVIHGPVVISGPVGPEGETTGLSHDETMLVMWAWNRSTVKRG